MPWPQDTFVAETHIGRFTATKGAGGVAWKWESAEDNRQETILDHGMSAIGPQSLGNALWALADLIPNLGRQVELLDKYLTIAYGL